MQIMIGCAKDMRCAGAVRPALSSVPMFRDEAAGHALQMMRYDEEELCGMLRCNIGIARENRLRYLHFMDEGGEAQAVLAYTGIVYKYLRAESFSADDFAYAQKHLWITSFLYGLLRPADMIKCYRLEGGVVLPDNGVSMFDYWKPRLTDVLVSSARRSGGVLLDIASSEMRRLFDWKRVAREVRVVRPEFFVRKDGMLKTVVVYSKMCRGAMARYVITGRIDTAGALAGFSFDGFCYDDKESSENRPVFILE